MSDAPLMLSISGLRGVIGQSLTPEVASRYGQVVGQWFKTRVAHPHLVIGRDSRPSGPMVEAAMVSGLLAVGCQITQLGIASTPGVGLMIDQLHADGGIVVTASHNPLPWNGLKVLRHDGVSPPAHEAQQIIDAFTQNQHPTFVLPAEMSTPRQENQLVAIHRDRILAQVDQQAIREAHLKVVLDSVHGAGGPETGALLDALGVERVHLWAEPTGLFPHTPEPLKENLVDLAKAVVQHKADIGFAQDPDADRLAVVDNTGCYIGEEYTLALAALHVFQTHGTSGKKLIAVTNLSTSRMIDDLAADYGATVLRSKVGEANVVQVMQDEAAIIGGEGNGGVIWPVVGWVRNSLVGIALILEMLAKQRRPLDEIVRQIPAYTIVKKKVTCDPAMVSRIEPALREAFADQQVTWDTQDGVRADWPDRWIHVRPSNTEPVLRLIAEAPPEAPPEVPSPDAPPESSTCSRKISPDAKGAMSLIQQAAEAMGLSLDDCSV